MIKVSCDILAYLNLHISNSTHKSWIVSILSSELYAETTHVHESQLYIPLNFREQQTDAMSSLLPRLKDGLTLIKEQNSIANPGLPEDKLKVLSSTHATQSGEVNQQYL